MNPNKGQLLSVSALTAHIRTLLESSPTLAAVDVVGEISNYKRHQPSGHIYFSLVDQGASISCVMFRREAARLLFEPASGSEVLLRGRVSLYEKTGRYQIYVEQMLPKGAGSKQLAYEALKEKLLKEGVLKSPENRRPLPSYPKTIGIVTSPTGAVIRDMVRVLRRRWPPIDILLSPAPVQGEDAGPLLVQALERLYEQECLDLIIIGRGGGSQEDLWCFNHEDLVRTVAKSPVPIISAVGHETDVSLTDFAADLRAGTPSMAAELAVPAYDKTGRALLQRVTHLSRQLDQRIESSHEQLRAKVRYSFYRRAVDQWARKAQNLDHRLEEWRGLQERAFEERKRALVNRAELLDGLSPLKVLGRGYAVVEQDGRIQKTNRDLAVGDRIDVRFQEGAVAAQVEEIYEPSH